MRSYRIGSAFGIPIEVDLTFLLVLPVLGWSIGAQVSRFLGLLERFPGGDLPAGVLTTGLTPWILGTVAALGLFVCVLLHELGHSVVALYYGYDIESIKLWVFGGVAQFLQLPDDPRQEFAVALVGPLVSVLLGALCYVAFGVVSQGTPVVAFVVGYLSVMNVTLAAFNLLPAFPMDGGRVLRAWLARTRSFADATRTAARVGKVFAFLLGVVGLLGFNLLLVGIAFFIYVGAESEARQAELQSMFEGVTVGDLMAPAHDLRTVDPQTRVSDLVARLLRERHTGYPVVSDGRLVGIVTLDDLREVPPAERDAYRVADVMTTDIETVRVDADPVSAFQRMQQSGVGRLPVVDERGTMVGLLSRTDLVTAMTLGPVGGLLEDLWRFRTRPT